MRQTLFSSLFLSLLTACAPDLPDHVVDGSDQATHFSQTEAYDLAIELGVSETNLIYADMLPLIMSDDEAMATWGFIERYDDDYLVTYGITYINGVLKPLFFV